MFYICVTVGIVLLASKYYNNILWNVKQLCLNISKKNVNSDSKEDIINNKNRKELKICLDKVILADSPEKCDYAIQLIHR
jgi:hypothetical protein